MDLSEDTLPKIRGSIDEQIKDSGFECSQPFLVGWYNQLVDKEYALPYPDDAVAFITVSNPSMYGHAKSHFLKSSPEQQESTAFDPVDQWTRAVHARLASLPSLAQQEVALVYDHDLQIVRRIPRVLVQTAGHVAGVAYFYQPKDFAAELWPEEESGVQEKKTRFGVAIHPRYGGWFGFRAVIVLPQLLVPSLPQSSVPNESVLRGESVRVLLEEYNTDWQANRWRDVLPPESVRGAPYEPEQVAYFAASNQAARKKILLGQA